MEEKAEEEWRLSWNVPECPPYISSCPCTSVWWAVWAPSSPDSGSLDMFMFCLTPASTVSGNKGELCHGQYTQTLIQRYNSAIWLLNLPFSSDVSLSTTTFVFSLLNSLHNFCLFLDLKDLKILYVSLSIFCSANNKQVMLKSCN